MDLHQLGLLHRTDKAHGHNYMHQYAILFGPRRFTARKVIEIGIGAGAHAVMMRKVFPDYRDGASLRVWRDYFTNAVIHGLDIVQCEIEDEHRIKTIYCDQSSAESLQSAADCIGTGVDFIIDDGSHVTEHQVKSFIHLSHLLTPDGIYVIEDVQSSQISRFLSLDVFNEKERSLLKQFSVQHIDLRNGTADDSSLIVFRRKMNDLFVL